MNTILQKYLVFIKLNQFMMSCFGHTHICLAGEEKYEKPREFLQRDRISTFVAATPSLSSN